MKDEVYWKSKLDAFLHDPPCKALGIYNHEEIARQFKCEAGLTDYAKDSNLLNLENQYNKKSDHVAAAADRLPFPNSSKVRSDFKADSKTPVIHPLCSSTFYFKNSLPSNMYAESCFQDAIGSISPNLSWKDKFLLYWRRWPEEAAKMDPRLAFLVADTRIPDHTIWNHMSLTSAINSCINNQNEIDASFLLFQIGPVQNFIAQARSQNDLWSGSYMLSYLIANGLKVICDELGPDHVIFPSMRQQPLIDLFLKESYERIFLNEDTLWDRINKDEDQFYQKLKTPTLPNRFLIILPSDGAKEIAQKAEQAIRTELKKISEQCWKDLAKITSMDSLSLDWKQRYDAQVDQFLEISYQIMPWNKEVSLHGTLKDVELLFTQKIPLKDREEFYYIDKVKKDKLSNIGFTWPMQYEKVAAAFSARRTTKEFKQFITDSDQKNCVKDSLSGKEEIIGNEQFWEILRTIHPFKTENKDAFGAMNIIKRLWCATNSSYLPKTLSCGKQHFPTPDLSDNGYWAVICLDGDDMGKHLSGACMPLLKNQLSKSMNDYFESNNINIESIKRPLSPSYHTQFSEALSNFALHIASPVVNAFKGHLIYAGGDDILAVVPAQNALTCAVALRSYFRGKANENIDVPLQLKETYKIEKGREGWVIPIIKGKETYPLLVPGTEIDMSCGICIVHKKMPLQIAIKEAHNAEKRAKTKYSKGAFAMSIHKGSGEIIHWGGKWDSYAIALFDMFLNALNEGEGLESSVISNRFAYSLSQLLRPYKFDIEENENVKIDVENMKEIIQKEFEHVINQQAKKSSLSDKIKDLGFKYLDSLSENKYNDFEKLFLCATFINRKK